MVGRGFSDTKERCCHLCAEGRFQEAEAAYTELLTEGKDVESGELALIYNNRGHARYMQVKFPLALEDLSLALSLAPSLASAHYNWATIQYRMGCYTTALPAFLRAAELDPGNCEFLEGVAGCREALGQAREVLAEGQ